MHLIRNSLDYASWKDRKAVAAALRPIYTATTAEAAHEALEEFAGSHWGAKCPTIVQSLAACLGERHPVLRIPTGRYGG